MENIIYNELVRRGYSVDVGVVRRRTENSNEQKEIDFVVNSGDKRVYIQSALRMETDRKGATETEPLFLTGDFFRKVVIRMDISRNYHDENGIWHLGLTDFLLGKADLF